MSGRFYGTFENNSVYKKRVVIPATFKEKINGDDDKKFVYFTIGPNNSILVFPPDTWEQLNDKLQSGTTEQKNLLKKLLTWIDEQQVESNGRVRINDKLMEYAGIKDKDLVTIYGEVTHFSIWKTESYKEYDTSTNEKTNINNYDRSDFWL